MDSTRLNTIARLFAARRSRRQVLARAGTSLAAGALAAAGLTTRAAAQDAAQDPPAPAGKDGPTFLFIQSFLAGGVAAKAGAAGRYVLNLEQGLGHTVYFSDRPHRVVGATPTPQFLEELGFTEETPPNAALVVETDAGETQVAVLALHAPTYDLETRTATYEIEVLQTWERSAEAGFAEADADLAARLPSFGAAHLFIDTITIPLLILDSQNHDAIAGTCAVDLLFTCQEGQLTCVANNGAPTTVGAFAGWPYEFDRSLGKCLPCGAQLGLNQMCNSTFPDVCGGNSHGV
jgi:hypothetical protein